MHRRAAALSVLKVGSDPGGLKWPLRVGPVQKMAGKAGWAGWCWAGEGENGSGFQAAWVDSRSE
jgi:hypothetical protein